ncbi:hypothetical protein Ahy_A06g026593 isoform A [Arachis hypogaea]|uniref:Uncharacterized protein n=1 Tax=Arachis hypogaea TaxID=3818 RepID=A0A445CL30_ARAHY|nr:hypothetical protein Ahy_A06g026593 isoform A [Arachis hypogaea]
MVLWHGVCCREAEERSRDTAGRSERCILESTTMDMQFGAAEMILKAIDATEDKSQLQRRKRPATVLRRLCLVWSY